MTEETVRGKTAQCKLTENEFIEFEGKAKNIGLSTSSYLRVLCLKADKYAALKPLGSAREKLVQCRLSEDEYKCLEEKANLMGLSVSSYLRVLCLSADICVTINPLEKQQN